MMILTLKKCGHWIGNFLYLQLFISLIALPILLCWGLPISLLSPVGNLLFGPALTLFLLLSSLLFFSELFYIPNGFLASVLDRFTQYWLAVLKVPSQEWFIGFARPSGILLVLIPLCALAIIHYKHGKNIWIRIACLTALLVAFGIYTKIIHAKKTEIQTLACNKGAVTLVHDAGTVVLIDPGVIGQRVSAQSWVEFTLLSHLVSSSGATVIDHVVLLQPGAMLFQAITTLLTKITVKKLYLVYWQGSLAKHEWRSFFEMRETAQKQGVAIERISYKTIHIPLKHGAIMIEPLQERITDKEINYPAITVHGDVQGQFFDVISSKYKQ